MCKEDDIGAVAVVAPRLGGTLTGTVGMLPLVNDAAREILGADDLLH